MDMRGNPHPSPRNPDMSWDCPKAFCPDQTFSPCSLSDLQIKPSKLICNKDRDHICIQGMMSGPLHLEFITFPFLSKVTSSRSLCPIKVFLKLSRKKGCSFFLCELKLLLLSPVESTLLVT